MMSNILIIDDDPNVQELLRLNLEQEGHAVDVSSDGEEALRMIRNGSHDLILLDVVMPRMDGWEVCKRLKDNLKDKTPRIIVISGNDKGRHDVISTKVFKADLYIEKPFDVEKLVSAVNTLLDEHHD